MANQPINVIVEEYIGSEQPFVPGAVPPIQFELEPLPETITTPSETQQPTQRIIRQPVYVPSGTAQQVKYPLILNIETLGVEPKKDRIITISFQDGNTPEAQPTVLIEKDELEMLKMFLRIYVDGGYNQLITYNGGFDFRFIVAKMMYYRLPCREFLEADIEDVMQIVQQGRTGYMYNPQKAGNLSDWADYLLQFPKPFIDVKMMEYYKAGNYNKVIQFATEQITRTLLIWMLWKAIADTSYTGNVFEEKAEASAGTTTIKEGIVEKISSASDNYIAGKKIQCKNCLAEQELRQGQTSKICSICRTLIS